MSAKFWHQDDRVSDLQDRPGQSLELNLTLPPRGSCGYIHISQAYDDLFPVDANVLATTRNIMKINGQINLGIFFKNRALHCNEESQMVWSRPQRTTMISPCQAYLQLLLGKMPRIKGYSHKLSSVVIIYPSMKIIAIWYSVVK